MATDTAAGCVVLCAGDMIGQRFGPCWLNLFGGPRECETNSYGYMNKAKAPAVILNSCVAH